MSVKQTVYFMALVGAMAGLATWGIQSWISDLVQLSQGFFTVIVTAIMGGLIGGMTVGFSDKWSSERVVPLWVAAGVFLGALAGTLGGLVYLPIQASVGQSDGTGALAFIGRPLTWLIAGALIGFVTGLRWFSMNRLRSVHAMIGGLVGGGLGGLLFTILGTEEVFQALAFMITGVFITLGVALAPVLLRDGVLQFISSADPRAQNKYASPRQEWVIQEGDRLVIGSQGSERNMTVYARAVDVYIPDAMVAKRHAVLFAKGKRFYIQQHPENAGPQGQPLSPLQVNNHNVTATRELHDRDELVVGQTLLRFVSRQKQVQSPAPPAYGGHP
jgi:hypothetical protein